MYRPTSVLIIMHGYGWLEIMAALRSRCVRHLLGWHRALKELLCIALRWRRGVRIWCPSALALLDLGEVAFECRFAGNLDDGAWLAGFDRFFLLLVITAFVFVVGFMIISWNRKTIGEPHNLVVKTEVPCLCQVVTSRKTIEIRTCGTLCRKILLW